MIFGSSELLLVTEHMIRAVRQIKAKSKNMNAKFQHIAAFVHSFTPKFQGKLNEMPKQTYTSI